MTEKKGPPVSRPRLPDAIREISRMAYEDRIPRLMDIIDNPESKPTDVVAAMTLLERNGFGLRHEVNAQVQPPPLDLEALRADILACLPRVNGDDEEPLALPRSASGT